MKPLGIVLFLLPVLLSLLRDRGRGSTVLPLLAASVALAAAVFSFHRVSGLPAVREHDLIAGFAALAVFFLAYYGTWVALSPACRALASRLWRKPAGRRPPPGPRDS